MQKLVIGIDIGGTSTKFGLAARDGRVIYNSRISTTGHDSFETYFDILTGEIEQAIQSLGNEAEILGAGVGAPNGNIYTGTIENAPNLPWKYQLPIAKLLQDKFNIPAMLTNDANAAAIGEMVYGGAKGMRDFVVITLGTGLGSGIVANGSVVYGHDGYAAEMGHVTVRNNGRQCACGKKGCLETYVSATGLKRTLYKLMADEVADSGLRDISYNDLSTTAISDAALNGDPIALKAFEYTGKILGRELANTVAYTSPAAIFLFGGLAKAEDLIFDPTKKHMEDNLLSFYKGKVKILPSGLGDENAPILGASSLIWKHLEENNS
ncbi:MAG: ROK family protein [Cyclobacteriaceae bacterium]|nr:ROK family protein [Cyclobacteriaceae bacterium]